MNVDLSKLTLMKSIATLIIFLLTTINIQARGWEKIYGYQSNYINLCFDAKQLSDSSYLAVGYTSATYNGKKDIALLKLDKHGDKIWQRVIGKGNDEIAYSIIEDQSGNYLVAGHTNSIGNGSNDFYLLNVNPNGHVIWEKTYGGSAGDVCKKIIATQDGNYILAGYTSSYGAGNTDVYLIKINPIGDTIWTKTYGDTLQDNLEDIIEGYHGRLALTGRTMNSTGRASMLLLDSAGNVLLDTAYQVPGNQSHNSDPRNLAKGYGVTQTSDSNFVLCGAEPGGSYFGSQPFIMKVDPQGTVIWDKSPTGFFGGHYNKIIELNGDLFITARDFNYGIYGVIGKYTANGTRVWRKYTPFPIISNNWTDGGYAYNISKTLDNNLVVAAYVNRQRQMHILKLDSSSTTFVNKIAGYVYNDKNKNCVRNTNENRIPVSRRINSVKVSPGRFGLPYSYIPVNGSGYYEVALDTGTYQVSYNTPRFYEQLCPTNNYSVHLSSSQNSLNNDFAMILKDTCVFPRVDISASRFRPCRSATFYVSACNQGTVQMNNAQVIVTLPDSFSVNNSSIPWNSNSGSVYSFSIGTLNAKNCTEFTITGIVGCSLGFNSSMCSSAELLPAQSCYAADTLWDNSSLKVDGNCIGDSSVCFLIKNISTSGNMLGYSEWRLYEDTTLIRIDSVMLNAGDSSEVCFQPNNATYRLEVTQRPFHPGDQYASSFVEGCGSQNSSTGIVGQFPQYDSRDNYEEYCAPIFNSFDPNDKSVIPNGFTSNHYINAEDNLEYLIRFQNLGNDTAFNIKILDTIDINTLDINSIESGISSHNYTFRVLGTGVVEWYFENILLPDSATDPSGSEGFVKFKINQIAGNMKGDVISNNADIYFDFNSPIRTNTVINTIWDTTLSTNITTLNVNSSISDTSICQNDSIVGLVSVTSGFKPYSYIWEIDDSIQFNSSNISFPAVDTGIHKVELKVIDGFGEEKDTTFFVSVGMKPISNFSYLVNQRSVTLTNNSTNTQNPSYLWDLGDGTSSNLDSLTYNYMSDSLYTICLTAQNSNGCLDSSCKNVSIFITSIDKSAYLDQVNLFPNPVKDYLYITPSLLTNEKDLGIVIVDNQGRIVYNKQHNNTNRIDISQLAKGVYTVRIQFRDELIYKRILKQ